MVKDSVATLRLYGRFSVFDPSGSDLTPARRKECGLLALLALAPERRRTRAWIMDKLWSTRAPDQASASLRRALSNLRRDLGAAAVGLEANRFDVWLTDRIAIDAVAASGQSAELFEGLDVPDPEFEDWLRDMRQAHDAQGKPGDRCTGRVQPASRAVADGGTVIVLNPPDGVTSPDETFLVSFLLDTLSSRLMALGEAEVHIGARPAPERIDRADTVLWIDVASAVIDAQWHIRFRVHADRNRRFLWTGGTVLPMNLRQICEGPGVSAFVSSALSGIMGRSAATRRADSSAYIRLQRAAARLFTGSLEDLQRAEVDLTDLSGDPAAPAPLAWRAFACLTRVLEFREDPEGLTLAARSYAQEAINRDPTSSLALSVAAAIELKLGPDVDRGHYLAQRALQHADRDPYALDAMAQAEKLLGNGAAALKLAALGRDAARGLPNAFFWDMEVCLAAVGLGEIDAALSAAQAAHLQNGLYRPALRYLCALNLLQGDHASARRAGNRLRALETDFDLPMLMDPDYPIHTLRQSGRHGDLPTGLTL